MVKVKIKQFILFIVVRQHIRFPFQTFVAGLLLIINVINLAINVTLALLVRRNHMKIKALYRDINRWEVNKIKIFLRYFADVSKCAEWQPEIAFPECNLRNHGTFCFLSFFFFEFVMFFFYLQSIHFVILNLIIADVKNI
jgi:hypothetical protein